MGVQESKPDQQPLTKADIRNTRKSILLFSHLQNDQLSLTEEAIALCEGDQDDIDYLTAVLRTIPQHDDPTKLDDFHYHYVNGKLVNISTGTPFHWVNQAHYDALGDVIVRHIQGLLVSEYRLKEVLLPLPDTEIDSGEGVDRPAEVKSDEVDEHDAKEESKYSGPFNNIFVSHNWKTAEKLMLLIQGSGAVRAGQWARALCINESLDIGSIFPYVKRSHDEGFGIIVFNPNLNFAYSTQHRVFRQTFLSNEGRRTFDNGNKILIKHNSNPHKHMSYVWDHFVRVAGAKIVAAVAHSAGGDGSLHLIRTHRDEIEARLCGIAFTDSVHGVFNRDEDYVKHFVQKRCRNWVTSKLPLDTPVRKFEHDCLCVSAGHEKHEYTSGSAYPSVFDFLLHRIEVFPTEDPNDRNYDGMPAPVDSSEVDSKENDLSGSIPSQNEEADYITRVEASEPPIAIIEAPQNDE